MLTGAKMNSKTGFAAVLLAAVAAGPQAHAETFALTDALASWAKTGAVKAQAAISSAAADSFDMVGFLLSFS